MTQTTYVLNTTVVPCEGLWDVSLTTLNYAKYLVGLGFTSAVGHESTATLMSTLLDTTIPVNRITVSPVQGDTLLCFKLKQRAPEGKILTIEELEALGYEFFLMNLVYSSVTKFREKVISDYRESELLNSRITRKESRNCLGGHRD